MIRNWPGAERSAIQYGSHRSPRFVSGQRSMVEYQRFSEEYFSGCDVSIYFGDVLVDDIVTMQFSINENVAPIYGYASYTYDAVARGTRLIQGSFRISFKEAYYIHAVTNELENERKTGTTNPPFEFTNTYRENTIEGILAAASNMAVDKFENLADVYEESLWGSGTEAFKQRVNEQENSTYFYPKGRQPSLHKDGLNIMITYGKGNRDIWQTRDSDKSYS